MKDNQEYSNYENSKNQLISELKSMQGLKDFEKEIIITCAKRMAKSMQSDFMNAINNCTNDFRSKSL